MDEIELTMYIPAPSTKIEALQLTECAAEKNSSLCALTLLSTGTTLYKCKECFYILILLSKINIDNQGLNLICDKL